MKVARPPALPPPTTTSVAADSGLSGLASSDSIAASRISEPRQNRVLPSEALVVLAFAPVKELPSQYLIQTWFQSCICGLVVELRTIAPDCPSISSAVLSFVYCLDVPRSPLERLRQSFSERHQPPPCMWMYHLSLPAPVPGLR